MVQKLTSLEEDFALIGLNREIKDVSVFGTLNEEIKDSEQWGEKLEEALKIKKLKRMSPADRAKARASYRSQKSKIKLKKKKLRKKPAYKRHAKKLKSLKKGRSAGAHRKFVVTGLEQIGNLQESINQFVQELDGTKKDQMELCFENVKSVAALLADRLDEAEAYVDEMSGENLREGFMKPEIYQGKAYVVDGNQGIDIVPEDVVGDLGLKVGEEINDDDPRWEEIKKAISDFTENSRIDEIGFQEGWIGRYSAPGYLDSTGWNIYDSKEEAERELKDMYGDEEVEEAEESPVEDGELDFLDDEGESEEGEEFEGDEDEEDDDSVYGGEDFQESRRISDNLRTLMTEAEDILSKFKTDVLSPSDAESILRDMVSYLGGAIKTFIDVAKGIEKYSYAGKDDPESNTVKPENQTGDRKVVGQDKDLESEQDLKTTSEKRKVVGDDDKLDMVKVSPEGQTGKRKVVGDDDKLDQETQSPTKTDDKRTIVGQDKLDDKLEMDTNKAKQVPFNQKKAGEISVYESMDKFTRSLCEDVASKLSEKNRKVFESMPRAKMIETAYEMMSKKKIMKESDEQDAEEIAKEVGRMILANAIANEANEHEETKHEVSRPQEDIMDTAPEFARKAGFNFDKEAEKIARKKNLVSYVKDVLRGIRGEFDSDELASEIFHRLLGTGGSLGGELSNLVRKIVPNKDAESFGYDDASKIVDAWISKHE